MYSNNKKDKVLEFYIRIAEDTNFIRTAVTLTVNGLIITGQIIPARQYFEDMIKEYSDPSRGQRSIESETKEETTSKKLYAFRHDG